MFRLRATVACRMNQEHSSHEVVHVGYFNWRQCLCAASKGWAVQNAITVIVGWPSQASTNLSATLTDTVSILCVIIQHDEKKERHL